MGPENDEPGGAAKARQALPFASLSPFWRRSSLALAFAKRSLMPSEHPKKWEEQGCGDCRQAALVGLPAPLVRLGHIGGGHFLYRCEKCGAYWEETLRYAHEISKEEAETLLPSIEK